MASRGQIVEQFYKLLAANKLAQAKALFDRQITGNPAFEADEQAFYDRLGLGVSDGVVEIVAPIDFSTEEFTQVEDDLLTVLDARIIQMAAESEPDTVPVETEPSGDKP